METIYGESPDIYMKDDYNSNGGISLFSVGDGEGGTITGGSGDNPGESETSARIKWAITVDAEGKYISGGITGNNDWMRGTTNSPFAGIDDQTLANYAINDGNLNEVFIPWNASHDFGDVFGFMIEAWKIYPSCVYGFAG